MKKQTQYLGLSVLIKDRLGPVVQRRVSLRKSLEEDLLCLSLLTNLNAVVLFAVKLRGAFAFAKAPYIFPAKCSSPFVYNMLDILKSH